MALSIKLAALDQKHLGPDTGELKLNNKGLELAALDHKHVGADRGELK